VITDCYAYSKAVKRGAKETTTEQDSPQDKGRLKITPAIQENQDKEQQRRATTGHIRKQFQRSKSGAIKKNQSKTATQLLDCTLHPDRWWWRLLLYIPDVLYILYIRVVPPDMGMGGTVCWRGPGPGCTLLFPPRRGGKGAGAGETRKVNNYRNRIARARWCARSPGYRRYLISRNRDRWLALDGAPDRQLRYGIRAAGWRSRSTSVPG
jgi:hypothetical protein